jgi:hypothetical protein
MQKPDGGVATLNLLDEGLMPYTRINGSTFPAPDPAVVGASPSPSDPEYADKILQFVSAQAPDTFNGEPVNFGSTFLNTVTYADSYPNGDGPESVVPLRNLELWGAPTSHPTVDPANGNFIYQRFQRGIMHYDKTCGCTQGLLLADYLKAVLTGVNLPPDLEEQARTSAFYRQYAPNLPGMVARPADLPATDLTNAFLQQVDGATQPPVNPLLTGNQPAPSGPTPSTPVAVPPASAQDFAYGYAVHLLHFSQEGKDLVAGLIQNSAFGWAKHQVDWSTVELGPGQYDWAEMDSIVNTLNQHGLKVMLSVVHAPQYLRGPNTAFMPANNDSFRQFMQTIASRYQGKVQAYELWNEENLDRETGPGNVNPNSYLQLVKAGYAGLKAGDPNAFALLGAPSPTGTNIPGSVMDDLTYLQQLFAINDGEVRNYYDILAAHPSGFSNPPDCTSETPQCSLSGGFNDNDSFFAFDRVRQYRQVMEHAGDAAKKIWFTEYGYGSTDQPVPGYEYTGYVSEQQQADFLLRAFRKALETGYVGGIMVWNLNYQTVVPKTDEKWAFGLLRSDYSGRPAFYALRDMPKPARLQ